jgi:hypothetical protein
LIFSETGAHPNQIGAGLSGHHALVAAHAPTNDNEQTPVLVPQTPGEEIALPFLAAAVPLGNPLAHVAPEVPFVLVFTPMAHPLARAAPPIPLVLVFMPMAHPLARAAPPIPFVLVFMPMAHPLARAAPRIPFLLVLPVAHPLAPFAALLDKVCDEIPQILPRPDFVHQEIAQIAVNIAIAVAPFMS